MRLMILTLMFVLVGCASPATVNQPSEQPSTLPDGGEQAMCLRMCVSSDASVRASAQRLCDCGQYA